MAYMQQLLTQIGEAQASSRSVETVSSASQTRGEPEERERDIVYTIP
jgi:hypothetical protein